MADLAQQIRERLDGFAPTLAADAHALFAYTTPPELSDEESERWAKAFQETVGDEVSWGKLIRLPPAPRFYPGFEQMRAALLAALGEHRPIVDCHDEVCEGCDGWSGAVAHWPCPTIKGIAKALGIEVEDA